MLILIAHLFADYSALRRIVSDSVLNQTSNEADISSVETSTSPYRQKFFDVSQEALIPLTTSSDRLGEPTFNEITNTKSTDPLIVLLVNSLGRGGSTWTSQIIETFSENTINIFEPLILLQVAEDPISEKSSVEILNDILQCEFNLNYSHSKAKTVFRQFFKTCSNGMCNTTQDWRTHCEQSTLRLVKVNMKTYNFGYFQA